MAFFLRRTFEGSEPGSGSSCHLFCPCLTCIAVNIIRLPFSSSGFVASGRHSRRIMVIVIHCQIVSRKSFQKIVKNAAIRRHRTSWGILPQTPVFSLRSARWQSLVTAPYLNINRSERPASRSWLGMPCLGILTTSPVKWSSLEYLTSNRRWCAQPLPSLG